MAERIAEEKHLRQCTATWLLSTCVCIAVFLQGILTLFILTEDGKKHCNECRWITHAGDWQTRCTYTVQGGNLGNIPQAEAVGRGRSDQVLADPITSGHEVRHRVLSVPSVCRRPRRQGLRSIA